ncbi:hypothetical protein RRG08_057412 [Elysia crispata]|uniref:Uncharacterized protein n=1 Tax=Elysia crispata TaxID=231223 RepID=A0AAE1A6H6_9GAST|nr:hypothetical protein RRG08_057412 [Elysia crispata]
MLVAVAVYSGAPSGGHIVCWRQRQIGKIKSTLTQQQKLCDAGVGLRSLKPDFKGLERFSHSAPTCTTVTALVPDEQVGKAISSNSNTHVITRLIVCSCCGVSRINLTNRLFESAGRRVPIGIVTGFRRGMSVTYSNDVISEGRSECFVNVPSGQSNLSILKSKILLQTQFMRGRWD